MKRAAEEELTKEGALARPFHRTVVLQWMLMCEVVAPLLPELRRLIGALLWEADDFMIGVMGWNVCTTWADRMRVNGNEPVAAFIARLARRLVREWRRGVDVTVARPHPFETRGGDIAVRLRTNNINPPLIVLSGEMDEAAPLYGEPPLRYLRDLVVLRGTERRVTIPLARVLSDPRLEYFGDEPETESELEANASLLREIGDETEWYVEFAFSTTNYYEITTH